MLNKDVQTRERERERERGLCTILLIKIIKRGIRELKLWHKMLNFKAFNELYSMLGMKDGYIIASLKFTWIVPNV